MKATSTVPPLADATKNPENVIQRRRTSDWKKPSSVPHPDVFGWREGDAVAYLDSSAFARVSAALSGARAITAVLMQHDIDSRDEDSRDCGLAFKEITTFGLFEALASCIELADLHATGGSAFGTTSALADDPEAVILREAAFNTRIQQENRRAAERVEQINRDKAVKATKKGAA